MRSLRERIAAVSLHSERAHLRPLVPEDFDELRTIAYDEAIWAYSTGSIGSDDQLRGYLRKAQDDREVGVRFAFAVVDQRSGKVAGSMSYGYLSPRDSRLEIGWSWLGRPYQGTGLNRHAKYLLLAYALEELTLERVEFKTDVLNAQARRALRKVGATEEGVLRSHTLMHDGRRRDTIYYSVLQSEWGEIRRRIYADLAPVRVVTHAAGVDHSNPPQSP